MNVRSRSFGTGIFVVTISTIIYVYLIFPTLMIIPISFGSKSALAFPPTEYSLDLYRSYLSSPAWLEVTYRSIYTASFSAILALFLGVPGAYALSRTEFWGKQVLIAFLLSPIFTPTVVIALGMYLYFLRIGLSGTVAGIVIAHVAYVMPFVILTVSSGINQLDERLETSATIMGASRLRIFVEIVLPALKPSLISAALFAFLMSFDEVVIAWFVTGPHSATLPVKMYSSIMWDTSPILAVVATVFTIISVLVCVISYFLARGQDQSSSEH